MHLSVGMPLPSDLLFDIQHYRGISPSSSGSTTPEGIPPGHRSPALEPICEGKLSPSQKKNENKETAAKRSTPITKVSSADCLVNNADRKVRSNGFLSKSCDNCSEKSCSKEFCTKSCEDFCRKSTESLRFKNDLKSFPNYENIDFLRNDAVFSGVTQKLIGIQTLNNEASKEKHLNLDVKKCNNETENNVKEHKFAVPLRRVPKNFTRNRLMREARKAELENESREPPKASVKDKIKFLGKHSTFEVNKPNTNAKFSNLSLQSMAIKGAMPASQVTQKYVNIATPKNTEKFNKIPDVVSSTLTQLSPSKSHETASGSSPSKYSTNKGSPTTSNTFSINKNIFDATQRRRNVLQREKIGKSVERDIPDKPCDKMEQSSSASGNSSSLVKSIIDSLNRRDRSRLDFGNRAAFGRSSLKVMGNPKVDVRVPQLRSCSPEEFTAL